MIRQHVHYLKLVIYSDLPLIIDINSFHTSHCYRYSILDTVRRQGDPSIICSGENIDDRRLNSEFHSRFHHVVTKSALAEDTPSNAVRTV